MRKRSRACEECHRHKIRCEPADGGCERCVRNSLECIPAAPRLQRDRITELEAQVEELRGALREKSGSLTPGRSPGSMASPTSSALSQNEHQASVLALLDSHLSLATQDGLLRTYTSQAGMAWPVVRLMPHSLEALRAHSPVLLLAIVLYTAPQQVQGLDIEGHEELVRQSMRILGEEVIGRGQVSLDLVQALLVVAFWNKVARRGSQASSYQLVQIAADMAIDLGIAGDALQPSPASFFCRHEDPGTLEARRTWLACFVALSTTSVSIRRPNPYPWNEHHHDCLLQLESTGDPADLLLCQIARIVQITQEIVHSLSLCRIGVFVDGNDYTTYAVIESLKSQIDAWAAQIPPSLASSPTLKVLFHVAMINLYEVVLHTPTNKSSFAVPYIPGRIPVKDFPAPAHIIPPLAMALEEIVQHCHAVITTAAEMDPGLVLGLPTLWFAPSVLHALFVLVTTMVAATDPASTYGQYLSRDVFCIEECGAKLRQLTASLRELDPTMSCWNSRMIDATSWLEEWHHEYQAILRRYEANLANQGEMAYGEL